MNTELLYQKDSYLKEFSAKIIAVKDNAIILDKTAFMATTGGLQCDLGVIQTNDGDTFHIKDVRLKQGKVFHYIQEPLDERLIGKQITGIIDWERRYKQMRLHTTLHAISGVLYQKYGSSVTGGNITPEKARVDFEIDHLRQERVEEIKSFMEKIIQEDHKVTIHFMPRGEAVKHPELIRTKVNLVPEYIKIIRVVEIEGVDIQADGGVHVASTKEIGEFVPLKSENRGKNNKRLYFTVKP